MLVQATDDWWAGVNVFDGIRIFGVLNSKDLQDQDLGPAKDVHTLVVFTMTALSSDEVKASNACEFLRAQHTSFIFPCSSLMSLVMSGSKPRQTDGSAYKRLRECELAASGVGRRVDD